MVHPGERVAGSAAAAQGTEVKNQYARRRGTRGKECMTVTAAAVAEMLARFPRPDFDSAQLIVLVQGTSQLTRETCNNVSARMN